MGSPSTLERVIQAVGHTYRSIDIRCAAVCRDGVWRNAFAVARFSFDEPNRSRESFASLQAKYGTVRTARFWVGNVTRPFAEWSVVLEDLRSGILRVDSTEIRLNEPIMLNNQSRRLERAGKGPDCWPALEISVCNSEPSYLYDAEVERDVSTMGRFRDAYDVVRVFLEHEVGPTYASSFIISAPVFAQILSAEVAPKDGTLRVHYRHHSGISELIISGFTCSKLGPEHRFRFPPAETASTSNLICSAQTVVLAPEWADDDVVEFRLAHPSLGELDGFSEYARNLLPVPERNVLFAALSRFCLPDRLESALANPGGQEKKRLTLDQGAAFELHVGWLLGVLGLQVIVLGDYEYLVHPKTGVRLGSLDIVGFDAATRSLLLAACTLNPPKQEDFTTLFNVRRILQEEVLAGTSAGIKLVIFTGAKDQPRFSAPGDIEAVPVVDSDLLAQTVKKLTAGETVRLSDLLPDSFIDDVSPRRYSTLEDGSQY